MDTKSFNNKNFDKSRAVCDGIEREDGGGRVVLTERERQILDMWPKFEDGEHVWFGDKYKCWCGESHTCDVVQIKSNGDRFIEMFERSHRTMRKIGVASGERVKRPAPKVLDADGVEIKVGDTVWHEDGSEQLVEEMNRYGVRCFDGDKRRTFDPKYLTHTRPDSWERLEEDAAKDECDYFGFSDTECTEGDGCPACDDSPDCHRAKIRDLVRRAKALAGVGE